MATDWSVSTGINNYYLSARDQYNVPFESTDELGIEIP